MLYLLVTGGASGKKKHIETFDFGEPQWSSVSTELYEFIRAMVVTEPKKRARVSQLLKNPLLKLLESDELRYSYLSQTNVDADGKNLMKFSVAAIIN